LALFDPCIEFRLAEGHPYKMDGKPWVGGQEITQHFFLEGWARVAELGCHLRRDCGRRFSTNGRCGQGRIHGLPRLNTQSRFPLMPPRGATGGLNRDRWCLSTAVWRTRRTAVGLPRAAAGQRGCFCEVCGAEGAGARYVAFRRPGSPWMAPVSFDYSFA
jgi:hypothetical protein